MHEVGGGGHRGHDPRLDIVEGNHAYVLAMVALAAIGLIGLAAAMFLPTNPVPRRD